MRLTSFTLGSGNRVTVMLHGFLGSGRNLRTLAQRWSERDPSRLFLLMDMRGHGTSSPPDADTDLAAMGRDVLETAAAEGHPGPIEVVGHSMGGRVALAAAAEAPDRVTAVTMLDISPSPVAHAISESGAVLKVLLRAPERVADRREMRAFLTEQGLSPALSDWLLMNLVRQGDDFTWQFDRDGLKRLHDRVLSEDQWSAVGPLHDRIRCVRGGKSRYVPDADARRLEGAGCQVVTLPNAGHYVHVDALEELLNVLA